MSVVRRVDSAKSRRGSLRNQLIGGNIAALGLLLCVLGGVVRYTVYSFLMNSVNQKLEEQVRFGPPGMGGPGGHHGGPPGDDFGREPGPGGPDMSDDGDFGDGPGPPPTPPNLQRDRNIARNGHSPAHWHGGDDYGVRHFDLSGHPLGPEPLLDPKGFAIARQGRECFTDITVSGVHTQILSVPIREGGRISYIVQAGYALTAVDQAIYGLDYALLVLIPVGLLSAGLVGAYLTNRVLRRVRQTAHAAERIRTEGEGDFSARLPIVGHDEFSELAGTFNGLLGSLENAYEAQVSLHEQQARLLEQQRRFTADASHELKTPLTVIQGTAGMALSRERTPVDYQESLRRIDKASQSMSRLVHDLLLLAYSDAGRLGRSRIDLLAREILEQAIGGVAHSDVPIRLRIDDESLIVTGNETELVRLFSNLLDNALRYTTPPGEIHVTASRAGNMASITVADSGVGIAPEHLSHLGERFYRVDSARARTDGGSGLGLSICRGIVEAHEGTMAIRSVVGEGTTVTVLLPVAGAAR